MSSAPQGSPAAPERGGYAWRPRSPAAVAVVGAAIALVAAVGLGLPPIWALAVAIPCLFAAGVLLSLYRRANLRLRSAKRALATSEFASRRLYDGVAAGVAVFGVDGRVQSANPALLRLLGYDSERELAIIDFGEQVYSAPGTFEGLLRRVRVDGELPAVDLQLRRRDGLPLMVVATIRAHWDDAGAVERFEAAMLDIGELKFVERQRRSHERRFRRLFDSNAVGILFGNLRRGTMEEANGRMREIAGLKTSELPVLLDALTSGETPLLSGAIRVALESDGHTPPLEASYIRGDGTPVAVLVCAAIVDALQGDFVAVVVERPAGPERAQRTPDPERLYESVLDALPILVARFNRSGRLTYCNAACRAWFGFPVTPTGLVIEDLLGVEDPDGLRGRIELVLAGNGARLDVEVFQVGGRLQELEITLTAHRRPDGLVGGFLATMLERGDPAARAAARALASADNTYNI